MEDPTPYEGWKAIMAEDRRHDSAQLAEHLEGLQEEVTTLKREFDELKLSLNGNNQLTAEIHEWVGNAKGFFSVLGLVGNIVKWVVSVASAVALGYLILRGKVPEPHELPK